MDSSNDDLLRKVDVNALRKLLDAMEREARGEPQEDDEVIPGSRGWPALLTGWTPSGDADEDREGQEHVGQIGRTLYAVPAIGLDGHPTTLARVRFPDGVNVWCWQRDIRVD